MDDNISNFQRYIIYKIFKSINYIAETDEYIFDSCNLSDQTIFEIVKEGARYGIEEQEVRQIIVTVSENINTNPCIRIYNTTFNLSEIPFGQHIRIEIRHEVKGSQWVECVNLKNSLFILSSSISGLYYGCQIIPRTTLWTFGCSIDFDYRKCNKSKSEKDLILRLGILVSVKTYSPSVIHEIIDSQRTYQLDEVVATHEQKVLTTNQKRAELLDVIKEIEGAIGNCSINEYYSLLLLSFIQIGLSSYLLNVFISRIKDQEISSVILSSNAASFNDSFIEVYDNHFFIKENDNPIIKELNNRIDSIKHIIIKRIKKSNKKEGCYIAAIIYLLLILIVGLFLGCICYYKYKSVRDDLGKQKEHSEKLIEKCDIINKELKDIYKYSFTTGCSIGKKSESYDKDWVMCFEIEKKLLLKSFCVRSKTIGSLTIGIYNLNDSLIYRINNNLPNTSFNRININYELEPGSYYMKIIDGLRLQYHSSSAEEYSEFDEGPLVITGCCSKDAVHRENSRNGKRYYQYFYDIKYQLLSNN